jgi:branched-subunit amino acid transport protein
MESWQAWVVVIAMAAGTFAIRWSVLGGMHQRPFAPWIERALTLVLPAMFSAIALPMIVLATDRESIAAIAPKVLAAVATLAVAMRRRGYLLPLVIGMLVLHGAQWVLAR